MSGSEGDNDPGSIVYRAAPRRKKTFKACRTCRQQKSRCIVRAQGPCQRCLAIGRDCVFEEMGRSKGRRVSFSSDTRRKRRHSDFDEQPDLQAAADPPEAAVRGPSPRHNPSSSCQEVGTSNPMADESGPKDDSRLFDCTQAINSSNDLRLLQLRAPLTVAHAIIPGAGPPTPETATSGDSGSFSPTSTRRGKAGDSLNSGTRGCGDVISRGLVTEQIARELFQSYMANGNVFLPLLDSNVDTFETVRRRSPLLFTVIIAIAAAVSGNPSTVTDKAECLREAQQLAARSLFANTHDLETIQGMLLLSAYSERNWFAISHTHKLSQDNGLSNLLLHMSDSFEVEEGPAPKIGSRSLAQATRTALLVHQVELEVATGTARQSKSRPVSRALLRDFVGNKFSTAQDVRIMATVELTQLRDQLLQGIEDHDSLRGSGLVQMAANEHAVNAWYEYWESIYEDRDFIPESFQRGSLRLQRDYAFIIASGNLIGKLIKEAASEATSATPDEELRSVIDATLRRVKDLVAFIAEDDAYSWHLRWAPAYSAIFPVFISVVAFRLLQMRPGPLEWRVFQAPIAKVADVLDKSPYHNFAVSLRAVSRLEMKYPPHTGSTGSSGQSRSRTAGTPHSAGRDMRPDLEAVVEDETAELGQDGRYVSNGYDLQTEPFPHYGEGDRGNTRMSTLMFNHLSADDLGVTRGGMEDFAMGQDFVFDYRLFSASTETILNAEDAWDYLPS